VTFFPVSCGRALPRGEKDGAEDPVAGGAQHQLHASSGGAASPVGARPLSQLLAAAGRAHGPALRPAGCMAGAARPLGAAHGVVASPAGGRDSWRTDHGEREIWVRQGCTVATRQALARCCTTSCSSSLLHGTATLCGAAAPDCPSTAFKSTSFTRSCASRFNLLR